MKPAVQYDPLSPLVLDDPYPVYAQLREHEPVHWHEEMRSWVLTRYADCHHVLRNHQLFARDWRKAGETLPESSFSVQSLDPPAQTSLRSLFVNALRGQDLALLDHKLRDEVARLLDLWERESTLEVLTQVAAPLSLYAISELLGVEQPELASFAAVSDAIMRSMDVGIDPTTAEPGRIARQELSSLVHSWFLTSGRPGLLADVEREKHRAGVPDLYVRNTMRIMFQGGYSTMVAGIGNVVHTLARRPSVLDQFEDPGLVSTGVDELVRFDGPVQGTSRVATETTQIGDVVVREGEFVLTLFAAANHDPAQFDTPSVIALERTPNQHFGFGWGTHSCIGTLLAQMVLRALVSGLAIRRARLRLAAPPVRRRTATMRSLDVLPVSISR